MDDVFIKFTNKNFLKYIKSYKLVTPYNYPKIKSLITIKNVSLYTKLIDKKGYDNSIPDKRNIIQTMKKEIETLEEDYKFKKRKYGIFPTRKQRDELKSTKSRVKKLKKEINYKIYIVDTILRKNSEILFSYYNDFLEFLRCLNKMWNYHEDKGSYNYVYKIVPHIIEKDKKYNFPIGLTRKYIGGTIIYLSSEDRISLKDISKFASEQYNIPSEFLSFQGYDYAFSMNRSFLDIDCCRGGVFSSVNKIWRKYMNLSSLNKIIDKDISKSKVATIYVACKAHGYHLTIKEDNKLVRKLKSEIARLKGQLNKQGKY